MIAQIFFKLKQMTYLRQNLHDQVKILEKYAFSRSSIISLANAKSLCKIHFGHKNFICSPIFKNFAMGAERRALFHIRTILLKHIDSILFY